MGGTGIHTGRWVAVLLAGTVVLSAGPAALGLVFEGGSAESYALPVGVQGVTKTPGEGTITAEEAARIVREAFAIPTDFEQEVVSYNEFGPGNQKNWHLNWRKRTDRGFEHISVSVDAESGSIRNMNYGLGGPEEEQVGLIPVLSEEEARAKAEALAAKLQPEEFALTKAEPIGEEQLYQPSIRGPIVYRFRYVRLENGIPLEPDGFIMAVDGVSGRIREYSFQWNRDVQLPRPEETITPAEAERIFREKIGLRLAYGCVQKPGGPEVMLECKLVYGPVPGGEVPVIDAVSGRIFDRYGEPVNEADLAARPPVTIDDPAVKKGDGSGEPDAAPAGTMSREEALALATRLFEIPADLELEGSYFGDYAISCCNRSQKTWSFNWREKAENKGFSLRSMHVELDAVTGEVLSFHREDPSQPDGQEREVKIGREEAARRADDFIARVKPSLAGKLWRNPLVPQPPVSKSVPTYVRYNIQYQMLVNGIPVLDSGFNVGVDPVSGEVVSFWSPREEGKYPPTEGLMDEGRATELFLKGVGIKLAYLRLEEPYYEVRKGSEGTPLRYKLVYMINVGPYGAGPRWLDARSGELLDWGFNSLNARDTDSLVDIKGHWAEADIKAIVGRGILLPKESRFSPDAGLSRVEALEALLAVARPGFWGRPMAVKNAALGAEKAKATYRDVKPDSPHYGLINEALGYGIITLAEEFRPDAPVTREEMAVMIARTLGYKPLMEGDARFFSLPYRDAVQVSLWARNAVAMTGALGVFRADGGRINPQTPVTRAQMAAILVRLSRIVGR